MNGKLRKTWEVHCARCEHPVLGVGYGGSTAEAASELRQQYGWGTVNGLWMCRDCAPKARAERRAAQPGASHE